MKSISLLAVLLLLAAGQAAAQVAAPSLLPGTARVVDAEQFFDLAIPSLERFSGPDLTFVPINPAAMQWQPHSEVGVGLMKSSGTYDDTLTPGSIDFSGQFAGLRWGGEYASIGGEAMRWKGHSQATSSHESELTDAAVAAQGFGVLALGARRYRSKQKFHFDIGAGTNDQLYVDQKSGGASLRLGHLFYLGYAAGHERVVFNNLTAPGNNLYYARGVRAYGVALRSDTGSPWRVEVYRTHKEGQLDPTGSISLNEESDTAVVLEAQFGGLILGVASHNGKATGVAPVALDQTVKLAELNLAWITAGGWSTTLHVERMTSDGTGAGFAFTRKATSSAVSLGHRF